MPVTIQSALRAPIIERLALGLPKDAIKKEVLEMGYSEAEFEEAFVLAKTALRKPGEKRTSSESFFNRHRLLIVGGIVLLFIIGGISFYVASTPAVIVEHPTFLRVPMMPDASTTTPVMRDNKPIATTTQDWLDTPEEMPATSSQPTSTTTTLSDTASSTTVENATATTSTLEGAGTSASGTEFGFEILDSAHAFQVQLTEYPLVPHTYVRFIHNEGSLSLRVTEGDTTRTFDILRVKDGALQSTLTTDTAMIRDAQHVLLDTHIVTVDTLESSTTARVRILGCSGCNNDTVQILTAGDTIPGTTYTIQSVQPDGITLDKLPAHTLPLLHGVTLDFAQIHMQRITLRLPESEHVLQFQYDAQVGTQIVFDPDSFPYITGFTHPTTGTFLILPHETYLMQQVRGKRFQELHILQK